MSKFKTGGYIIADGACRFMELSSGVWTDATGIFYLTIQIYNG